MHKNTKNETIGGKKYCVYCGKESMFDREEFYNDQGYFDGSIDYNYCDCDGANAQLELQGEIWDLKNKKYYARLKENTELINQLKYEHELKELKEKYTIKK